ALRSARQGLLELVQSQREKLKQAKVDLLEQMRTVARLHNEHVSIQAQAEGLRQHRRRLELKTSQVNHSLSQVATELRQLQDADRAVQDKATAVRQHLGEQRERQGQEQQAVVALQARIQDEKAAVAALQSRQEVLEGLERSREGLGGGVRHVLEELERADSP